MTCSPNSWDAEGKNSVYGRTSSEDSFTRAMPVWLDLFENAVEFAAVPTSASAAACLPVMLMNELFKLFSSAADEVFIRAGFSELPRLGGKAALPATPLVLGLLLASRSLGRSELMVVFYLMPDEPRACLPSGLVALATIGVFSSRSGTMISLRELLWVFLMPKF